VEGEVIYVDHFGSLVTNIRGPDLPSTAALRVLLKGVEISGLVNTFGERPSGSIIALFSSVGDLIIAVVNGSAADRLGIEVGEKVTVLHS
jgi:hypothetical protein